MIRLDTGGSYEESARAAIRVALGAFTDYSGLEALTVKEIRR